jgi:hypothetical protein
MSLNRSSAARPRHIMDLDARHSPLTTGSNENRALPTLPTALSSMLRTTTESGDIGQFAIKPSRNPHRLNTQRGAGGPYNDFLPQRSQQNLLSTALPPLVDDRKRLPSYARDATSEIVSMYETASQKSPRRQRASKEPDHRSYSMTQTSYPPYPLTNHRSYASLKSQPELSLGQRPRSPFIYPTRLKRVGYRPSSPALTVVGSVDRSKGTEFGQLPNVRFPPSLILRAFCRISLRAAEFVTGHFKVIVAVTGSPYLLNGCSTA